MREITLLFIFIYIKEFAYIFFFSERLKFIQLRKLWHRLFDNNFKKFLLKICMHWHCIIENLRSIKFNDLTQEKLMLIMFYWCYDNIIDKITFSCNLCSGGFIRDFRVPNFINCIRLLARVSISCVQSLFHVLTFSPYHAFVMFIRWVRPF